MTFVGMHEEQRLEISIGSKRDERGVPDPKVGAAEDSGELP